MNTTVQKLIEKLNLHGITDDVISKRTGITPAFLKWQKAGCPHSELHPIAGYTSEERAINDEAIARFYVSRCRAAG